eukprot:scaffold18207_cov129-Isochrysis_galbana.AAC.6
MTNAISARWLCLMHDARCTPRPQHSGKNPLGLSLSPIPSLAAPAPAHFRSGGHPDGAGLRLGAWRLAPHAHLF